MGFGGSICFKHGTTCCNCTIFENKPIDFELFRNALSLWFFMYEDGKEELINEFIDRVEDAWKSWNDE